VTAEQNINTTKKEDRSDYSTEYIKQPENSAELEINHKDLEIPDNFSNIVFTSLSTFYNHYDANLFDSLSISDYLPHFQDIFNSIQFYLNKFEQNRKNMIDSEISQLNNVFHIKSYPNHEIIPFLVKCSQDLKYSYIIVNINSEFFEQKTALKSFLFNLLKQRYLKFNMPVLLVYSVEENHHLQNPIPSIETNIHSLSNYLKEAGLSKEIFLSSILSSLSFQFPPSLNQIIDFELVLDYPEKNSLIRYASAIFRSLQLPKFDVNLISHKFNKKNYGEIRNIIKFTINQHNITQGFDKGGLTEINENKFLAIIEQKENILNRDLNIREQSLNNQNLNQNKNTVNFFKENKPFDYISADLEEQLYYDAAYSEFDSLSIILDKLSKGVVLESYERRLLSQFPFLIPEDPNKAIVQLNRAKAYVDKVINFGK
jgi:hypothetical protein